MHVAGEEHRRPARNGDRATYIEEVVSSVATPVEQLRGFAKLALAPGEAKNVHVSTSTPDDLVAVRRRSERVVEPGQFRVMSALPARTSGFTGEFQVTR